MCSWWEVREDESGVVEARRVEQPWSKCSQWKWVQYDWSNGERLCFCNVWSPFQWLAKRVAMVLKRGTGVSGRRWKHVG